MSTGWFFNRKKSETHSVNGAVKQVNEAISTPDVSQRPETPTQNGKQRRTLFNIRKVSTALHATVRLNNMSQESKETEQEKLVCYFDESPYYILKVAAQGNLAEVERLVNQDASRLQIRDYREQNVIHHACTWSRQVILDYLYRPYIVNGVADINARDKLGNTPAHHAIERKQAKALTWLLDHGADITVLNKQNQTPIHYAVELGNIETVKIILKHSPSAVQLPGDLGYLPLHYACTKDFPEIAQLLLDNGADILQNCDRGYPAIHSATRNGSDQVVDVLMQHAKLLGMTEKSLIHTMDNEKNLPLHLAVNSGDIRGVRVCIKAGADIDRLSAADRQTAVHYAAAQGALDMIKEMFEDQPDKVETCIHCRDIQEQTPLHIAAMFNHESVVEYLIEMGASLNAQDAERRTPLLSAASKNAVGAVQVLLRRRANTSLKDKENRNFFHLAVLNNCDLQNVDFSFVRTLKQLLNERDDLGRCPIHYASSAGQLGTLTHLITLGAVITLKDNVKQSPLHVAAARGRYQTCKKLLTSENGPLLMNEVDADGRTAVHVAAQFGHYRVIALLVRKGALLNKDFYQNTPLHLAAANGHDEAVVFLASLAPHHLNAKNDAKDTPLHLSAGNGHACIVDFLLSLETTFEVNDKDQTFFDLAILNFRSDTASVVIHHKRAEEALDLPSVFETPMIGLIQHLPKICMQLMDSCVTYSNFNERSREYFIEYDFKRLNHITDLSPGFKRQMLNSKRLSPLETMVKYNRVELLSHPLSVSYLRQKWSLYGQRFYNIEVALYTLFLIMLTVVTLKFDEIALALFQQLEYANTTLANNSSAERSNKNDVPITTDMAPDNSSIVLNLFNVSFPPSLQSSFGNIRLIEFDDVNAYRVSLLLVVVFCFINSVAQVVRALQQGSSFFLEFSNHIEWGLYVCTEIAFIPHLIFNVTNNLAICQFLLVPSAIALFLGWFNMLLYLRRFDWFGLYIVMFVEVGKTMLRTLTVFGTIIIAFTLEFYLVLQMTTGPAPEFQNPLVAFITTITMMTTEVNYIHTFSPKLEGIKTFIFGNMAFVVYVMFLILLPTLLMNLLVGLAVGDIQATQKSAQLKRLAMQVKFFSDLELRLPEGLIRRFHFTHHKHYPNHFQYKITEFYRFLVGCGNDMNERAQNDDRGDNGMVIDAELSFVVEELARQSRQIDKVLCKLDSQQTTLKALWQRCGKNSSEMSVSMMSEETIEDSDIEQESQCRLFDSPKVRPHLLTSMMPTRSSQRMSLTPKIQRHDKDGSDN